MFDGFTNFRKFHLRRRDKSCSKDPYFLSAVIVVYKQSLCERDTSNCGKNDAFVRMVTQESPVVSGNNNDNNVAKKKSKENRHNSAFTARI